ERVGAVRGSGVSREVRNRADERQLVAGAIDAGAAVERVRGLVPRQAVVRVPAGERVVAEPALDGDRRWIRRAGAGAARGADHVRAVGALQLDLLDARGREDVRVRVARVEVDARGPGPHVVSDVGALDHERVAGARTEVDVEPDVDPVELVRVVELDEGALILPGVADDVDGRGVGGLRRVALDAEGVDRPGRAGLDRGAVGVSRDRDGDRAGRGRVRAARRVGR